MHYDAPYFYFGVITQREIVDDILFNIKYIKLTKIRKLYTQI